MKTPIDALAAEAGAASVCKPRVKSRIFEKACELFYRQGIRAVGVDAIASEAGTNKMSFYRSYSSKDDLVADYVRQSEQRFWEWWDAATAPHEGNPRRQAIALFESYLNNPCPQNDRGCAMANAAVEIREPGHPALAIVRAHKEEIRARFRKLARQMKAKKPDLLGDGLLLLLNGAYQSLLVFGCDGPGCAAPQVAATLIDAHLPKS